MLTPGTPVYARAMAMRSDSSQGRVPKVADTVLTGAKVEAGARQSAAATPATAVESNPPLIRMVVPPSPVGAIRCATDSRKRCSNARRNSARDRTPVAGNRGPQYRRKTGAAPRASQVHCRQCPAGTILMFRNGVCPADQSRASNRSTTLCASRSLPTRFQPPQQSRFRCERQQGPARM